MRTERVNNFTADGAVAPRLSTCLRSHSSQAVEVNQAAWLKNRNLTAALRASLMANRNTEQHSL